MEPTTTATARTVVPTRRDARRAIVPLFVASGASGLVLEVVWSRMLGWLLGATTWSVMAVLAAYMGGLGLGAWLWGRRVESTARPLRLFGLLEAAIGLYALAVPLLVRGLGLALVMSSRVVGDSPGAAVAVRVVLAALVLVPPTLLMGGTLPVLTRFASAGRSQPGRIAGVLYAANTAGAVAGCALAGCLLIPWLGVIETNTLAGLVDLGVGLLALSWAGEGSSPVHKRDVEDLAGATRSGRLALGIATLSGFCGLAYEVLWTRGLQATVTDDTTYAFALMLTAFLAGHALGAAVAGRHGRGLRADPSRLGHALGTSQVLAAASALLAIPLLVVIRDPISKAAFTEGMSFWSARIPFHLGISLAVFAPSAFFLGASFTLAARLYVGQGRPVGASTGRLYGLNTLGSILGAVVATAWLIPRLGAQGSLLALAVVQGAAGGLAIVVLCRGRAGLPARIYTALGWGLVVAVCAGLNLVFPLISVYQRQEPGRLLALVEGSGAAVTVHQRVGGDRVISINGVNVAGTNPVLRATQKLQAHLPACLHGKAQKVLQIGFGSGGTCYSVSLHPEVQSIEVVELNPDVLDVASRWFADINHGILNDPRVRARIVDAKSHVAATDQTYDLILSDSTHPRFRGNAALYARDYFAACARRLRPGGLFSTWLPLYGLSVEDVRGILKSFLAVFPHVQVWYANLEPHENTIIIASLQPIAIDPEALAGRLAVPAVADDLAAAGITEAVQVLDFLIMGEQAASRFSRHGRLNTDDHPMLEFLAPRSLKRKQSWIENFAALRTAREPVTPYLVHADPSWRTRLDRWYEGTTWKLLGQSYELEGRVNEALAAYAKGVEKNPEDRLAAIRLDRLRQALSATAIGTDGVRR
jgi:spermidine synthase